MVPPRELARRSLAVIIEPRYVELFELIRAEIERNGFEHKIPAGIVLTGGTSKMEGVVELAESIFQTSVRLGVPEKFTGMENVLRNPIYATSIGLLAYGNDRIKSGLHESPVNQVLVEECLEGWKEFEMEVVRDKKDNCIIICSIENVDPMGIHTGDSVTIAPALTLTDKEYQVMRNASIACLRKIGVETGGSNVQFAINPKDLSLIHI